MSLFYIIGIWDIISGYVDLLGKQLVAALMNAYNCTLLCIFAMRNKVLDSKSICITKRQGFGSVLIRSLYNYIKLSDKRKYGCLAIIILVTLGIIIVCGVLLWQVSDNTGTYLL